jgi:hypothetical protein
MQLFAKTENRDPAELVPSALPDPISYESQRPFVRKVLAEEVDLRARGTQFINKRDEKPNSPSVKYREQMNSQGSPSETVAAGYIWVPGTELTEPPKKSSPKKEVA